jgi:hypothetical protein
MGLSALLLAFGLGVISFAVIAGLCGFTYNSGEAQVRRNLAHREKMRLRQLARNR